MVIPADDFTFVLLKTYATYIAPNVIGPFSIEEFDAEDNERPFLRSESRASLVVRFGL